MRTQEHPQLTRAAGVVGCSFSGSREALARADYLLLESLTFAVGIRLAEEIPDDFDLRTVTTTSSTDLLAAAGLGPTSAESAANGELARFKADGTLRYLLDACDVAMSDRPSTG